MIGLRPPEVGTRPPIWNGENDSKVLEELPRPTEIKNLLYIVHPTAAPDGDFNKQAKDQIINRVNRIDPDGSFVVAILPPSESHFLSPGTKVSDIRADADERYWVHGSDLGKSAKTITLIGGNIERCLGATFAEVRQLADRTGEEQIILPLDAIYTDTGTSAATAFGWLLKHARSPLEAAVALLTIPYNPKNYYEYGNHTFEIISSHGRFHYSLSLNGTELGELKPEPPKGMVVLPLKDYPVIKLDLITPADGSAELPTELENTYQKRLMYARFHALPEYGIPAPEGEIEETEPAHNKPPIKQVYELPSSLFVQEKPKPAWKRALTSWFFKYLKKQS